jgi:SAM-dependent methyltransferase
MSDFWDQRYAEAGYKYGTTPNAFLAEQAGRLRPGGCVLLPGDGEGRNSVWLALRGLNVLAIDSSGVGLEKARALAAGQGAQIATLQADLAEWRPEPASADGVVLTFVHLPSSVRRAVHRGLAEALVPGGWLILEAFDRTQLGRPSGGPKSPDMLYPLETVRADFDGLMREEFAWSGELMLDEGPGHQGVANVVRYIGMRPR